MASWQLVSRILIQLHNHIMETMVTFSSFIRWNTLQWLVVRGLPLLVYVTFIPVLSALILHLILSTLLFYTLLFSELLWTKQEKKPKTVSEQTKKHDTTAPFLTTSFRPCLPETVSRGHQPIGLLEKSLNSFEWQLIPFPAAQKQTVKQIIEDKLLSITDIFDLNL